MIDWIPSLSPNKLAVRHYGTGLFQATTHPDFTSAFELHSGLDKELEY